MSSLRARFYTGFLAAFALLSSAAPTFAGWEPIQLPPTRPDSSLRVVMGAIVENRRPLPWSAITLADSQQVASLATALASETRTQTLGDPWVGHDMNARCKEYTGASQQLSEDYWMYRCGSTDPQGQADWFYYDLDPELPPTLERRLRSVIGSPEADRRAWLHAFRRVVAELSKVWNVKAVPFRGDSLLSVIHTKSRRIHIQLDEYPDPRAPRICVDQFSNRLWARMSELGWYGDETWLNRELSREDSVRAARRRSDAAALKSKEPDLARALSRDDPARRDTSVVFDALRRAARYPVGTEERDRVLYGVDRWLWWMFWESPDSAFAVGVDAALRPFGARVEGQGSVWHYEHGLRNHLESPPWASEWRERVFVDWMENLCEVAGDGNEWKQILARGTEFLENSRGSASTSEVLLHLAEAHETAWSVGITMHPSTEGYAEYRAGSSEHRKQAMALYERYLRKTPASPEAGEIRRRLRRMRMNLDTGFWKYYCPSEC
ncbi:MAG TPA: hypothetical protein VFP58_12290 [Candidatus Eisenbacteria bacterium]|nr:hypothetical protein [Candidatus Eisenbacteria bacterium]